MADVERMNHPASAAPADVVEDPFLQQLLNDTEKACTLVQDARQMTNLILYGEHIDQVLVLKNGLQQLGLEDSMPKSFRNAVADRTDLCSFLEALQKDGLELSTIDASLYYWDGKKEHRVKRDDSGKRVRELASKYKIVQANRQKMKEPLYIGELRYTTKRRMPEGGKSSTLLKKDVKDIVDDAAQLMPMWDRGHAFVGGKFSGSSVHCDQTLWSNIGKNWAGYKILFVWRYGEDSLRVLEQFHKEIIKPPFNEKERKILQSAAKVALVGPGDVFVFSGANAHMTLGVGRALSLTAYESYVNLNTKNVHVFTRSGSKEHFEDCIMEDSDLEDLKDDVVDNVEDMLTDMERQRNGNEGDRNDDSSRKRKREEDISNGDKSTERQREGNDQDNTTKQRGGGGGGGRGGGEAIVPNPSERKFLHSLVPSMVRELCKDKFYREELKSIRRIRKSMDSILREPRKKRKISRHRDDSRERRGSSRDSR